MTERRRSKRQRSWFVMRLEGEAKESWLAMSRNMSVTGALVATVSRLAIGEGVTLSFKLTPESDKEQSVQGTIVRVEPNAEDPHGFWPHRVAIEFAEELPEIEPRLAEDSSCWSFQYLLDMEEEAD